MSTTYTGGGYQVTIQDDHSILVQPGDWISKYAAAMYGDPMKHWDRFKRKQGSSYIDLADPNMIYAGETLYHPGPLPTPGAPSIPTPPGRGGGSPNYPGPVTPTPTPTPGPGNGDQITWDRVVAFLKWAFKVANPVTDWSIKGSAGVDLSAWIFSLQLFAVKAQYRQENPVWFAGWGGGFNFGPEDIAASGSLALPNMPGSGFIGKFATAGATLSAHEIAGTYVMVDIAAGPYDSGGKGGSVALLFFGMKWPPEYVIRQLSRYLRGDDMINAPFLPMGLMVLWGNNMSTPNLGIAAKAGQFFEAGEQPWVDRWFPDRGE